MSVIPHQVYWGIIAVLVVAGGWTQLQLADSRAEHAKTKQHFAENQARAFDMQIKQDNARRLALADLDSKHTKELNDAKSKIDSLAADVRAGRRGLRLAASCPASPVPEATGAASVVDATSPRLDDSVEQDYFNLRTGIETSASQIAGLQDYVTTVCLR